jgi:peroxin-1
VREGGLEEVARRTEGYSGADLQAVVYNAQLEAIHDVLGDGDFSGGGDSKPKTNGASGSHAIGSSGTPEFIHFRYGDKDDKEDSDTKASPAELAERVRISQQLVGMQAARRKDKQQRQYQVASHRRPSSSYSQRPMSMAGPPATVELGDDSESKEPMIHWEHLRRSLEGTRASISPEERKRLARIYREFVEGRTGDLPNGQGGSEIGGRASLM